MPTILLLTSLNSLRSHPEQGTPPCLTLTVSEADDIFFTESNFEKAKQLCSACPLASLCLEAALVSELLYVIDDHPECIWGVFGGLEPAERASLLMRRMATRGLDSVEVETAVAEAQSLLQQLSNLVRPLYQD